MSWSWFGDFFRAIPDALRAVYQFGDPSGLGRGWWGVVIAIFWGQFIIVTPLMVARRLHGKHEWASATLGVVGATGIMWWIHGILPSAWIYFVDANKGILQDRIIPTSFTPTIGDTKLDIASNLYDVIRDSVVMVMMFVAVIATIVGAIIVQKKLPKTLAAGEERPEAGGYH